MQVLNVTYSMSLAACHLQHVTCSMSFAVLLGTLLVMQVKIAALHHLMVSASNPKYHICTKSTVVSEC